MDLANILYERHLDAAEIERRLVSALLEVSSFDLDALTSIILDVHPERASWVGLLNRLWLASARGGTAAVREELDRRATELLSRRLRAADGLLDILGPRRVILTLSNPPCVITALAAGAGRRRVVMGESRPLREGVTAARDLAAVGVEVTVVTDAVLLGLPLMAAELPAPLHFEKEEAVVLLGADAILAEGFIAKSGSRALAEVAALAGLDLVVAASTDCLVSAALAARFQPPPCDPVDLGAPGAVGPIHRHSDMVPWRLATVAVVGSEPLAPAEIAHRTAELPVAPELLQRWRARY